MDGPGDRASKPASSGKQAADALSRGGRPRCGSDKGGPGLHTTPGSDEFGTFRQLPAREPGDLDDASLPMMGSRQPREGDEPHAAGQVVEESDATVVPKRPAKTWVTPVESAEGRVAAKGNTAARNASPTQRGSDALTFLQRIRERAKQKPKEKWTNLLSHVRAPLLKEAYLRLRKAAAPGIDGVSWEDYGERLDERLVGLENRIHRGSYHPQPAKRVHIPKGDGKTRPLGLPALEDKVVQQAVRMILEPIYEAEFVGISYGFRPQRSQHDALDALAVALQRRVDWVLDADIRAFFDTIEHGWLQRFIEHRIADTRLVRLLMKWLHAGVMEDGKLHEAEEGSPQGAVISPLLANIYLHYVFDLWVLSWRKKRARGAVYAVRYADDLAMGFQYVEDARAMRVALAARLAKFGLELHPDKTRVIEFGRFAQRDRERRGLGKPETFDFLGLTHIAGETRGKFRLQRRTSRKKRQAKLASLSEEIRRRRHDAVTEQQSWLSQVLSGHYRYYGVPTNYPALDQFRRRVAGMWHRSLQRRSQCGRWSQQQWQAFERRFPLPAPRIHHPWPAARFALR